MEIEKYSEDTFLAEFDKAIAEDRVRRGRQGEGAEIREAAGKALARLEPQKRKKHAILV